MPAQLHGSHQRISSLAKEARDVQPGLIKDSTMMRPAISDRPLATEAHPNPSIPEEDGVRGKFRWFAGTETRYSFWHQDNRHTGCYSRKGFTLDRIEDQRAGFFTFFSNINLGKILQLGTMGIFIFAT